MDFRHGLPTWASEKTFSSTVVFFVLSFLLISFAFYREFFYDGSGSYEDGNGVRRYSSSRMAICLVGGLRMFQLTGPSIQKNLLAAYPDSDVFVVSPADEDSWKLWLLKGSNVVAANVYMQSNMPEDEYSTKLIHPLAARGSRQGLLHYAMLVESCKILIEKYELKHKFQYKWVLRTRPDGLWLKPPPSLDSLDPWKFYIPPGSDYWGINDRFSLSHRDAGLISLSWVSSIPLQCISGSKYNLTSEEKFQNLLEVTRISETLDRARFPFCVLTHHWFYYPPDFNKEAARSGIVAPISAPDYGDGRYCKPCKPTTDIPVSREEAFEKFHTEEFCNASVSGFEEGWEQIFDQTMGSWQSEIRKSFPSKNNFWNCISSLSDIINRLEFWEGGFNAYDLCLLAFDQELAEVRSNQDLKAMADEILKHEGSP